MTSKQNLNQWWATRGFCQVAIVIKKSLGQEKTIHVVDKCESETNGKRNHVNG